MTKDQKIHELELYIDKHESILARKKRELKIIKEDLAQCYQCERLFPKDSLTGAKRSGMYRLFCDQCKREFTKWRQSYWDLILKYYSVTGDGQQGMATMIFICRYCGKKSHYVQGFLSSHLKTHGIENTGLK